MKPDIEFPNEKLEVFNEVNRRKDRTYLRVGIYFFNSEKECCEVMPFAVGRVRDGSEKGYYKMKGISDHIYRLFIGYQEGDMTFKVVIQKISLPFTSLLHPTDEDGNWLVNIEFLTMKMNMI